MSFTDFQKDCIQKAKDQLHLIPRIDHVIRWKDMPGKVSAIVRLQKSSALSIAEFSEELKISKKALTNFTKGKDHSGKEWNELLILVKPQEFKSKQEKETAEKSEITVSNKILAILNRDIVRDRGLRDDTIKIELKPIKPRFVSTVLNKLLKSKKIQKFIGENKKVMWKISEEVSGQLIQPVESIVPKMLSSEEPKVQEIPFPSTSEEFVKKSSEAKLKEAWEIVLANIELSQIHYIDEDRNEILIGLPLKNSNLDFPYAKWRKILELAVDNFPKLCKVITELAEFPHDWYDNKLLLNGIRKTQKEKKFKTEQDVIDHFEALLSLGDVKIA